MLFQEDNRPSNDLLILSSASGQLIGERKLAIPDHKETHCDQVIYEQPDKSQYILFGSGGETSAGMSDLDISHVHV